MINKTTAIYVLVAKSGFVSTSFFLMWDMLHQCNFFFQWQQNVGEDNLVHFSDVWVLFYRSFSFIVSLLFYWVCIFNCISTICSKANTVFVTQLLQFLYQNNSKIPCLCNVISLGGGGEWNEVLQGMKHEWNLRLNEVWSEISMKWNIHEVKCPRSEMSMNWNVHPHTGSWNSFLFIHHLFALVFLTETDGYCFL